MRKIFIPLLAALALPTAVNADDQLNNWFNNEYWRKDFEKNLKIPASEITDQNIDEGRIGSCIVFIEEDFPDYALGDKKQIIRNSCKALFKKYKDKLVFPEIYTNYFESEVAKETCLDAKDYIGCMKYEIGSYGSSKEQEKEKKIDKNAKRNFTRDDGKNIVFDPKTVVALNKKGDYGRYLKFNYRINYYQGSSYIPKTQITPDTVTTNTYGTINSYGGGVGSYSGNSYSTVTPGASFGGFSIPGGMRSNVWAVTVDCQDYTADWKGDGQGWRKLRGAKRDTKISTDMAIEIVDEFCPQMSRLVAEAKERDRLKAIEDTKKAEQRKNNTTGTVKINCNSSVWRDKPRCN
mgnify:CR=1 FL=1